MLSCQMFKRGTKTQTERDTSHGLPCLSNSLVPIPPGLWAENNGNLDVRLQLQFGNFRTGFWSFSQLFPHTDDKAFQPGRVHLGHRSRREAAANARRKQQREGGAGLSRLRIAGGLSRGQECGSLGNATDFPLLLRKISTKRSLK